MAVLSSEELKWKGWWKGSWRTRTNTDMLNLDNCHTTKWNKHILVKG